jgi:hypothetical protein
MVQLEAIGRTNGDDYAPQITAVGTTGEYVVTFSGVDSAGDYSIFVQKFNADGTVASGINALVVDSTIATPIATLTTDSGSSNSDNITNVVGLTLSTLETGATRTFAINGATATSTYTAPTTDGAYSVVVTDTDIAGNTSIVTKTFTLDSTAPTFTSATTATAPENIIATTAIYTAAAMDTSMLTYAISGIDSALFNINATTGEVKFNASPNFELPTDSGANNIYDFTVRATDTANNFTDQTVAFTVTDRVVEAGQSIIDLGSYGKLIAPVQVDGKWYYFWDRNGDGAANTTLTNGTRDYTTHDFLDALFRHDINGVTNTSAVNADGHIGTTNDYRFATLNGVNLALPTVGDGTINATSAKFLADNQTYTDLVEIWDTHNTGYRTSGTPIGWDNYIYWSATPSTEGHATVDYRDGEVYTKLYSNDQDYNYVALQVL